MDCSPGRWPTAKRWINDRLAISVTDSSKPWSSVCRNHPEQRLASAASKRDDVSLAGLVREAAARALADAQLDWADIDAVVLGKAPDTFTFGEISTWLRDVGFTNPRTLDAPGPSPIILANKAK